MLHKNAQTFGWQKASLKKSSIRLWKKNSFTQFDSYWEVGPLNTTRILVAMQTNMLITLASYDSRADASLVDSILIKLPLHYYCIAWPS